MAPDDPLNNEPAPAQFLFSGDGDRSQEEVARPEALPPPEGKTDPVTLQYSGALATRNIIATVTLWDRAARGDATLGDEPVYDTAVTGRVVAAMERFQARAADEGGAMLTCVLDAARETLGDAVFDAYFGETSQLRMHARLPIAVAQLMRFTVAATGPGVVHAGEWYVFANAPAYRYKHPAGAHDELCLCVGLEAGELVWRGLGVRGNEARMVQVLVERYNAPRDEADRRWLAKLFPDGRIPKAYADYADQIEAREVLGLDRSTGVTLNARALAALSERYR